MKIHANEILFERWRELGVKVGAMRTVVANDVEISRRDCDEWMALAKRINIEYHNLGADTYRHFYKDNPNRSHLPEDIVK